MGIETCQCLQYHFWGPFGYSDSQWWETISTEKQNSQFEDEDHPLSSTAQLGAICENRNLDICVIDIEAFQVVVVNQAGKLRVINTGSVSESTSEKSFDLVGITTGTTEARFSSQTMIASDQYCWSGRTVSL